jgi:SpoVK/Ycf46/Vps4 family AAA+-type ATPase
MTREEFLKVVSSYGQGEVPSETVALWAAAERKLRELRAREAATVDIELPLCRLERTFSLSQVELDILMLVAAPKIDPRYEEHWENIYRDLSDPSIRTAIAVLSHTFNDTVAMRRLFSIEGPLVKNSLILAEVCGFGEGNFLNLNLEVPRRVVGELLGESHIAEELIAFSCLRSARVPLDQVVLPQDIKEMVVSLVRNHDAFLERRKQWGLDNVITYGKGLVLLFSGSPGTGKTMLANAVAATLGKRLFCVDGPKLMEHEHSMESNLDAVFREARLLDAVLFFDECEQVFASRTMGNSAMPMLLTRIEQFDGVAILATNQEEYLDEALARRIVAKIDFRAPTHAARAEIWRKHLPAALPLTPEVDINRLAENFELTGGYIKNAVLAAVVRAVSFGQEAVSMSDLEHGARLQVRIAPSDIDHLKVPEARLDDLVLPRDLHERITQFVNAARARSTVLMEWGLGKTIGNTAGLAALFSGVSGTGKSMAAEAIASALERPMLRCPLSAVVSKYVGDTSRNIARLFKTAREHRAVLVFDEADALFARRVNVRSSNDRFVNVETASLLTEMEGHPSVVILTTNLVEDIDPAFDRRLHLRVAFPFPDARARGTMWKQMLGNEAPLAADVNPIEIGRKFDLSGGLIRNAVLAAALEAATQPVGFRQICHGMLERAAADQLREPEKLVAIGQIGMA